MPRTFLILALVALTAACGAREETGTRDTGLRQLRNPSGPPEEFGIVPNKPLAAPQTYAELPQPTPGGHARRLAKALAVSPGEVRQVAEAHRHRGLGHRNATVGQNALGLVQPHVQIALLGRLAELLHE